jgi:hypothetical protein
MYIDYTSLKKACSKDEYLLPRICQIMDSTMTCELLSFLDAYSSYHQIILATDDEEKTSFIMSFGIFCYTKMAFELKNGRAIYQKCVHIILENQRGDLLDDLTEIFDYLCKYMMMLNLKKCVFGVSFGKLLGYIVSSRGIDANPTKVEAIKKLQPSRMRREIQKLTSMMAALSRFISKLNERGMPFYKLLHKADEFQWDDQAAAAFVQLK